MVLKFYLFKSVEFKRKMRFSMKGEGGGGREESEVDSAREKKNLPRRVDGKVHRKKKKRYFF